MVQAEILGRRQRQGAKDEGGEEEPLKETVP